MSYFSNEEFDTIFREIVGSEQVSYDTLLYVSERMLKGLVRKWCNNDSALRGMQYEEDIMQEIQIKLIKKCVNGFFLRNGEPNYDPNGFKNWVFTVAQNVKNDFAKNVRRYQFIESTEIDDETAGCYEDDLFCTNEDVERLTDAFRIVMASDSKVYKVLTWIAQMLIIADQNVSKIDSNEILIAKYESMTLDNMLDLIIRQSARIPWLRMDERQIEDLRGRLDEPHSDGRRMGDMIYSDLFMKKGAKSTISDWVNRMNNYITKRGKQR
ncbi:MAG: sigma-70 family RNA polymerase sigma factor [Clostridia bacterium]|nr:sigma-70 family RNA polymerase sigma factor [Clostridia bacterium]